MRLIDADALIDNKLERMVESFGIDFERADVTFRINDIEKAPTVEAEPIIHGHWITTGYWEDVPINKCSVCGVERRGIKRKYCANCGAKMDEEVDND